MQRTAVIFRGVIMLVSVCRAEKAASLKDQQAKDSYSIAYQFGENLKRQEVTVDVEVLLTAVRDALAGTDPAMSRDEIRDTLQQLRQKVMIAQ